MDGVPWVIEPLVVFKPLIPGIKRIYLFLALLVIGNEALPCVIDEILSCGFCAVKLVEVAHKTGDV